MDYKELSEKLKELLNLKNEAVGIKLLKENDLPGYSNLNKYTFCQFIMKAKEGNKLLATADNVACANGSSALGFIPVPEKILNGEFPSKLGSFQKEGARVTMELMPRFKQKQFAAIALAPLSMVDYEPDIIVLETVPEQLMWLSLATINKNGGRLNFSTSISNGTCVDTTVVPYLNQNLNVSLGCYGCRNATDIPDENLLAGFPGSQLEEILSALQNISEKAMLRAREKRAYKQLLDKEEQS